MLTKTLLFLLTTTAYCYDYPVVYPTYETEAVYDVSPTYGEGDYKWNYVYVDSEPMYQVIQPTTEWEIFIPKE